MALTIAAIVMGSIILIIAQVSHDHETFLRNKEHLKTKMKNWSVEEQEEAQSKLKKSHFKEVINWIWRGLFITVWNIVVPTLIFGFVYTLLLSITTNL